MTEFPQRLPVARYRFDFTVADNVHLPEYAGSMIRGVFGRALRRLACMTRQSDCKSCPLYRTCVYTSIFETPAPEAHELQKFSQIPNPYVIEPPQWGARLYEPGERLSFSMVLIGRAREQLPIIIYSLKRGLMRDIGHGRAELSSVTLINPESPDHGRIVFSKYSSELEEHDNAVSLSLPRLGSERSLLLRFTTPLRLQNNGRALADITPQVFFNALIRRANLLMSLHAGITLTDDFPYMAGLAQTVELSPRWRWKDWQRFSSRQHQAMKLGGLVGECLLTNIPDEFLPFLFMGQWVHLGKNATFGLGKYEIQNSAT